MTNQSESKQRREWWLSVYKNKFAHSIHEARPGINVDPKTDEYVHVREVLPGDVVLSAAEVERLRKALVECRSTHVEYEGPGCDLYDAVESILEREKASAT